jgi:hypothetical protein
MISAAATIAAFNLLCSGTLETISMSGNKSEPFTKELRVDLSKEQWCEGACAAVHKIHSVQPTQITFEKVEKDTPSERSLTWVFVNRETGSYHGVANSRTYGRLATIIGLKWTGQCERKAFTGFPSFETKF